MLVLSYSTGFCSWWALLNINNQYLKRHSNLWEKICSIANLQLADKTARKGKKKQIGIKIHDKSREQNILDLHKSLINRTYRTSRYSVFTITEEKERVIYKLPYYPDRIVHHAIMKVLEPIFVSVFTADTYSCIKGRGIHGAFRAVKNALGGGIEKTRYCLKLDIQKFYPSIDHDVLKSLLRKKFKDKDLLWLLDEIIDSAEGVPIGNYLSQFLANFYFSYFDHWLKENKRVKHYFRYCDDLVILASTKEELHLLLAEIRQYLEANLKLQVKSNYQIFPVSSRGIDFVGYKFFHTHILLRKRIKLRFLRMMRRNKNYKSIASYNGWLCHCDTKTLINKYFNEKERRN